MDKDGGQTFIDPVLPDPEFVSWGDKEIQVRIKNDAIASDVRVKVGGIASNPDYFTVTCGGPGDCVPSACCSSNICRAAAVCAAGPGGPSGPHIDSIEPDNGTVGNLVTIFGSGFDKVAGSVYFTDGGGAKILADIPNHPQCVAAYWFDKYIIVKVPANTATGQVSLTTAAGDDSNAVNFTENGISRPGLCKVDPVSGLFGAGVNLYGNNFVVGGDDILFGSITGDNNNILNAGDATTNVPNLMGGVVSMQVKDLGSNELSNPLPFTVMTVGGGDPIINSISPNAAIPGQDSPRGQYVTVMGANFGNFKGNVTFSGIDGDFKFPAQCDDSFWRNDRIIVKVPPTAPIGNNPVIVTTANGKNSPPFNAFAVNVAPLNPGLCKIEPNNGPVGTKVDFYGDNFGKAQGTVEFYKNQTVNAFSFWNPQQAGDAVVPNTAQTGVVILRDVGLNASNEMMFSVGECTNDKFCAAKGLGTKCCEGNAGKYCANSCQPVPNVCTYPWEITSEPAPFELSFYYCGDTSYQTPTPWPDGAMSQKTGLVHSSLESYVNTNLMMNFTRNVLDVDLLDINNFKIIQCNTGGVFDITKCVGAPLLGVLEIVNDESDEEGVMFNPNNDLVPDTWYNVELGTFHATVGGDIWPLAPLPPDYWHFKIRKNTDACVPTRVDVSPQSPASDIYIGKTRTFTAIPRAKDCSICGGKYKWDWTKPVDPSLKPADNDWLPKQNVQTSKGSTVLTGGSMTTPGKLEMKATLPDFGNLSGSAQC
ncbi:MAG: hypothetical protein V1701_08130, partial [Planctomycetota bacterium]